jgi:hypothetical protein
MSMQKKIEKKQKKEQDAVVKRYEPIAQSIFKLIAEANIPTTAPQSLNRPKEAVEVTKKILELLLAENVEVGAMKFIFQLALGPLDYIQTCVLSDYGRNEKQIICNALGIKEWDDRTLGDLEKIANAHKA